MSQKLFRKCPLVMFEYGTVFMLRSLRNKGHEFFCFLFFGFSRRLPSKGPQGYPPTRAKKIYKLNFEFSKEWLFVIAFVSNMKGLFFLSGWTLQSLFYFTLLRETRSKQGGVMKLLPYFPFYYIWCFSCFSVYDLTSM